MTLHIIGPTKVINDMTVSALDLSDPDKFLADIKKEFLATGSKVEAEQLFCRRYNRLKRTTAYIRYDFALQAFEELYGRKPQCD
jgi:uncharacterized protein (DUF1919 family)